MPRSSKRKGRLCNKDLEDVVDNLPSSSSPSSRKKQRISPGPPSPSPPTASSSAVTTVGAPYKRKGAHTETAMAEILSEQRMASSSSSSRQHDEQPKPPSPRRLRPSKKAKKDETSDSSPLPIDLQVGPIGCEHDERNFYVTLKSQGETVGKASVWTSDGSSRGKALEQLRSRRPDLAGNIMTLLGERHQDVTSHQGLRSLSNVDWTSLTVSAARSLGVEVGISQQAQQRAELRAKIPIICFTDLPAAATKANALRPDGFLDFDPASMTLDDRRFYEEVEELKRSKASSRTVKPDDDKDEEDNDDDDAQPNSEALPGASAIQYRIRVPKEMAKNLGLPEGATLSAAATPRSTLIPDPLDETLFELSKGTLGLFEESAEVFRRGRGRKGLHKTYALRLYAHAVKLHVECTDGSFKIMDFLAEHAHEPWTPAVWISFDELSDGQYRISVCSPEPLRLGFKNKQALRKAGASLVEQMRVAQQAHGRALVKAQAFNVAASWAVTVVKEEILSSSNGIASFNPAAFRRAVAKDTRWRQDGPPDEPLFCRGGHRGKELSCHPTDALFARKDLYRGRCARHALSVRVPQSRIHRRSYTTHLISRDGARGKQPRDYDIRKVHQTKQRLLGQPQELDSAAMLDVVLEGDYDHALPAMVTDAVGLSREVLYSGPEPKSVPRAALAIRGLSSLQPSLDQVRQYTSKGKLADHGTPGTTAIVPAYLQRRKSSHPFVIKLHMLSTFLARANAARTIAWVSRLLSVLARLNAFYQRASRGAETTLPADLLPVDEELHRLLDPSVPANELDFSALKALLETTPDPRPDIRAETRRYGWFGLKVPGVDDECEEEVENGDSDGESSADESDDEGSSDDEDDSSEVDGDEDVADEGGAAANGSANTGEASMNVDAAAAKAAATAARRAAARAAWKPIVDAFASMTPGEEKQLVDQLNRVVGMLQAQYPDRVFKRNRKGCPVFDWPEDTPTRDVFRFFLVVSLRMVFICDEGEVIVEWGPHGWTRTFVAYAAHYAQFGGAELSTLLPFALGGRRHDPSLATWGGHTDHSRGFFPDVPKFDLATIDFEMVMRIARGMIPQSWPINMLIGSKPIGVLRVIFAHSRAGCLELIARLAPHFDEAEDGRLRLAQALYEGKLDNGLSEEVAKAWRFNGGGSEGAGAGGGAASGSAGSGAVGV